MKHTRVLEYMRIGAMVFGAAEICVMHAETFKWVCVLEDRPSLKRVQTA